MILSFHCLFDSVDLALFLTTNSTLTALAGMFMLLLLMSECVNFWHLMVVWG